jgi:hypothetical protein
VSSAAAGSRQGKSLFVTTLVKSQLTSYLLQLTSYLLRRKDNRRYSAQIYCMNQAMLERHLAQAEEHVAHWREHVARQMQIVAELEAKGQDATAACGLLGAFQAARESLEGDLGEIKKALVALDKVPTEPALACRQ